MNATGAAHFERQWAHRPPPRGLIPEEYQMCPEMITGLCLIAEQCTMAHSAEELAEWRLRFAANMESQQRHSRARQSRPLNDDVFAAAAAPASNADSFGEELLKKWMRSPNPETVMSERLPYVDMIVSGESEVTMSSKVGSTDWLFRVAVAPTKRLRRVALIQDWHRPHFRLASVKAETEGGPALATPLVDNQEWVDATVDRPGDHQLGFDPGGFGHHPYHAAIPYHHQPPSLSPRFYAIHVQFQTTIYGTFRQTVCFDFGEYPVLVKRLCVDSLSMIELDKLMEVRENVLSHGKSTGAQRWTDENCMIVEYGSGAISLTEGEKGLLRHYPPPDPSKLNLSSCATSIQSGDGGSGERDSGGAGLATAAAPIATADATPGSSFRPDVLFSKDVYVPRMHELLAIEELAMFNAISQYNVQVELDVAEKFLLLPAGFSSVKQAAPGTLYAKMNLEDSYLELSEDTAAGRLFFTNVTSALLRPVASTQDNYSAETRPTVYEAVVEEKGKNYVFFHLSKECVVQLGLKPDSTFSALIQFQLNRLPICEMHHALDKVGTFAKFTEGRNSLNIVFSDPFRRDSVIPPTPRLWGLTLDPRLNVKQREAIVAIATPLERRLPPILVIGPFGTGKTYTLAQAAKTVLEQDARHRVLICTHSNSAADLYIREYLDPYVESGHAEARPLRLYYKNRWIETVQPVVLKYCVISNEGITDSGSSFKGASFAIPSLSKVMEHRVVVATLGTAKYLSHALAESLACPPEDLFTHIFIDEAAQALAPEILQPLTLAGPKTRIVLAGDPMQLSPEIHSTYASEQGLGISILEQLFRLYPAKCPEKIMLCENYRSTEAIVNFTSRLFYRNELYPASSSRQMPHPSVFPLTFYAAKGVDVHYENSLGFYNVAEVYEVVDRIEQLEDTWPESWGEFGPESVGVVTPYADQVWRIRSELRKRNLANVSVERVLNVQGKQFRVIFLSTVRTRCTTKKEEGDLAKYSPEIKLEKDEEDTDFGFLSNPKLLNTAVTRAQSLVAVVGDPVALCSVGKCRKIWERFIEVCRENDSLHGMTNKHLEDQLKLLEIKKFKLNPLAPEFVPSRFRVPRANAQAGFANPQRIPGFSVTGAWPAAFSMMNLSMPSVTNAAPSFIPPCLPSFPLANQSFNSFNQPFLNSLRSFPPPQFHYPGLYAQPQVFSPPMAAVQMLRSGQIRPSVRLPQRQAEKEAVVESVSALDEDLIMEASKLLVRLFPSMPIEHLHSFIMSQVHANVSALDLLSQLLRLQRDEKDKGLEEIEAKLEGMTRSNPSSVPMADHSASMSIPPRQVDVISSNNGHASPAVRRHTFRQDFSSHNGVVNGDTDSSYGQDLLLKETPGRRRIRGSPFANGAVGYDSSSASSPDPIALLQNLQIRDATHMEPHHGTKHSSASPDPIALLQNLQIRDATHIEPHHGTKQGEESR